MSSLTYPSDLTSAQWRLLVPRRPPAKPGGRSRTVNLRQIVNGVAHQLSLGYLPRSYGPWSTISVNGGGMAPGSTWLREAIRRQAGPPPTPSAAIIESQSVKATEQRGPSQTTVSIQREAAWHAGRVTYNERRIW